MPNHERYYTSCAYVHKKKKRKFMPNHERYYTPCTYVHKKEKTKN